MKKLLSVFLLVALISSIFSGCSSKANKDGVDNTEVPDIGKISVERKPESQALQIASAATALALNQYIYARLKTEELLSVDNESITVEEFQKLMDELVLAWKTADMLISGSQELADQAGMVLKSPVINQTAAFVQPASQLISLDANSSDFVATALGTNGGREIDPETWAETLTKQLDEIAYSGVPQFERIKTLAAQLGVDAKTAYDQVDLAQKIIHNIADLDELRAENSAYSRSINIVQGYKTASKVGLLVTATIASGGGSLATLGASSMTLGEAGALVVGGVDCIVDVAATSSTIILGEDHQVTTEIGNIQNKLAPISFVVGLASFNGAYAGEQLAYIGDSLTEWYYNGKILGVNISSTDDGGTKVTAQPIDVTGLDEAEVKSELEESGFVAPEAGDSTLSSIIEEYRTRIEEAASKLATLAAEMAAIMEQFNIIVPQPEENSTTVPAAQQMAGTYSGSATLQHIEEDVESPDSLPVTLQLNEAGTGTVSVSGYSGDAQCAGSNVSFQVTMKDDGAVISCVFEGKASRNGSQIVISGNMYFSMMGVTFASYSWTAQK